MLSQDTAIRPNEAVVASKVIDGEAIMINLTNGRYYSMQGPGSLVWKLVSEGTTPALLAGTLRSRYEAAPGVVERDVNGLVDLLLQEQLVLVSDDPVVSALDVNGSGDLLPYESPHLEVYTDMGDLLALDPPLPGLDDIPWRGGETTGKPGA